MRPEGYGYWKPFCPVDFSAGDSWVIDKRHADGTGGMTIYSCESLDATTPSGLDNCLHLQAEAAAVQVSEIQDTHPTEQNYYFHDNDLVYCESTDLNFGGDDVFPFERVVTGVLGTS